MKIIPISVIHNFKPIQKLELALINFILEDILKYIREITVVENVAEDGTNFACALITKVKIVI